MFRDELVFDRYHKLLAIGTRHQPSQFVLYYDQVFDVLSIPGGIAEDRQLEFINGDYGNENQSAMVFDDGHAGYLKVDPGATKTDDYQVQFDE